MLAMLVTGEKNKFILIECKKVRRDFGPGELESGVLFNKNDIIYLHNLNFERYIDSLDWELIQEEDNYIIHNNMYWIFKKEKGKSVFSLIISQVFENNSLVDNLF